MSHIATGQVGKHFVKMEQVCGNCEYFVQVGGDSELEAWGDCMNPEATWVNEKGETKGVFRWAKGGCIDFKARLEPS